MTAADLLTEATARLQAAGVPSAAWDAERLLRHLTGWSRADLLARPREAVPLSQVDRFRELLARRESREPLQYIVGTQEFWRREFQVGPSVLIPRPETELLVEAALRLLGEADEPVVLDVGTGSGCIALSIAADLPRARVHATEISAAALELAQTNARRLGLIGRVVFHQADLISGAESAGPFDLVVSNPPYVDPADHGRLAPEVAVHEPALALFAPDHGLAVYRRLLPAAAAVLTRAGHVLVEIGADQCRAVEAICDEAGLVVEDWLLDLQSIPRAILARPGYGSAGVHRSG